MEKVQLLWPDLVIWRLGEKITYRKSSYFRFYGEIGKISYMKSS
ncbi:hypothetical protein [Paenibacillus sp. Soil766]|nr:hypothetical protein [Paenibacillus sp. Soil766]